MHYKPLGIRSPEFTTSILWHEASKKPTVEALLLLLPDWDATHKTYEPLKGYPQWVREGAGNRGEPEGPPTLPPLVH